MFALQGQGQGLGDMLGRQEGLGQVHMREGEQRQRALRVLQQTGPRPVQTLVVVVVVVLLLLLLQRL